MNPLVYYVVLIGLLISAYFHLSTDSNRPQFIVSTYSSMTSDWGAGVVIRSEFEKICECDLIFRAAGDANLLLHRLKVQPDVNIILGLDQLSLDRAASEFQWSKYSAPTPPLYHPIELEYFVPFDWSPMTLIGRKPLPTDMSLKRLLSEPRWQGKIALQDPATSSPGLQFLFWATGRGNLTKSSVAKIRNLAHSISPGWSSSYGLFQKKQAEMVFSYTTSPVFHEIEESTSEIQAITFNQPLPVQVEYVAIPHRNSKLELSKKFIEMLLTDKIQDHLMRKNYMLPISKQVQLPSTFAKAKAFDYAKVIVPKNAEIQQRLRIWQDQ